MLICKKGYVVKVLSSLNGYYLGTFDDDNGPNCRLSSYVKNKKEVNNLDIDNGSALENVHCSGGNCEFHVIEDSIKEV